MRLSNAVNTYIKDDNEVAQGKAKKKFFFFIIDTYVNHTLSYIYYENILMF